MAEIKYTKTIVVETSDGQVTLTGNAARAMARRLEDSSRYFHLTTSEGVETYYDINSASCGFCKVATVTAGTADAAEIPCEDGLPTCEAPAHPGVHLDNKTATVKVGETVKLNASVAGPTGSAVVWSSSDSDKATVANGVVTGVADGEVTITVTATIEGTTYTDTATITVEA